MVKMHIAIEGFDGTGKTTLAKNLAKKLEFEYIQKPMSYILGDESYLKAAKYINATQNELMRALFYSCGNVYALNNFEKIVTDRHLLSSFFYNYSELTKELYDFLNSTLRKPDLTVLLYCDNKVRKERIIKRNPQDKDIERVDLFNMDDFKRMQDFLEENNYNFIVIDTSNSSEEEIVAEIIKAMNKKGCLL